MNPSISDSGAKAIAAWEARLIDLSKRNRLLNFPKPDAEKHVGLSTIPIISPDISTVFDLLTGTDKFYPVISSSSTGKGSQLTFEPIVYAEQEQAYPKNKLVSSFASARLQTALSTLRNRSRTSIDERGVNILFIAFGALEWVDPESRGDIWRTPIILTPVAVDKQDGDYLLGGINEDTLLNPALEYKFQHDFGIRIDDIPEGIDSQGLQNYFDGLDDLAHHHQVKFQGHISVERTVYLGIFSFAKITMFQELILLGPENLLQHDVVALLAGSLTEEDNTESVSDPDLPPLDQAFQPTATFQVIDADSSQQEAILLARKGKNLAIQGPPGTGKSQTIVNLIADALAFGKTILFVSEKRVALDVVKRRMDECGLGSTCLVIHSGRSEDALAQTSAQAINKKDVLSEIEQAWASGSQPPIQRGMETLEELAQVREKLNQTVTTLHQPRFALQQSIFNLIGHLELLREVPKVKYDIPEVEKITYLELSKRLGLLREFRDIESFIQNQLPNTPWQELLTATPTPEFLSLLKDHLESFHDLELDFLNLLTKLREGTGLQWPTDYEQLKPVTQFFRKFIPQVLLFTDIEGIQKRFANRYCRFISFLFKKGYEADCTVLKPYYLNGWDPDPHVLESDLKRIGYYKEVMGSLHENSTAEEALTLSELMLIMANYIEEMSKEVAFLHNVFSPVILTRLQIDHSVSKAALEWSQLLLERFSEVPDFLRFVYLHHFEDAAPVNSFIDEVIKVHIPASQWERAYNRRVHEACLEAALNLAPNLAHFTGESHQRLIDRFRDLDRKQFIIARREVANRVAQRRPTLTGEAQRTPTSEIAILTREFKKQRRIKPLRKLFIEAQSVIQAIKPCFMMSPLTVSQYLVPTHFKFDIVIFDEASQIRVEDAIGSIYRGKQVIVVGDEHQLPPTRFFDVMETDDDYDEEATDATSYESILTRCEGEQQKFTQSHLKWHYRSKYEELIAFSNKEFYNNELQTFPHPCQAGMEKAIDFVYIKNGLYDRGGTRCNLVEAGRVAEGCMEFARQNPDWSLGVVAFSETQKDSILAEVECQLQEKPELRSFFDDHRSREDRFIVKNLELIQGDERDVMFFSIGYGHDASGSLTQNFGPLNQEAGRRRLNVAVTRARFHVTVYSSVQPEDLTNTTNEGVRLLRDYLLLARDGLASLIGTPEKINNEKGEVESPFEAAVLIRLKQAGLQVHAQIGCSGYRIDLGIVDPQIPGRYCLGVECDGATYHSARTARDRDRLRQEILEHLGWHILRIWSRDWNAHPEQEIARVVQAVKRYSGRIDTSSEQDKASNINGKKEIFESVAPEVHLFTLQPVKSIREAYPDKFCTFTPYTGRLHSAQYQDILTFISQDITQILTAQGPTSVGAMAHQVCHLWGYARISDRLERKIYQGIHYGVSAHSFLLSKNERFLYTNQSAPLKIRLAPDGRPRAIDEYCPEELYLVFWLASQASGGSVTEEGAIHMSANALGFQRLTQEIKDAFKVVLDHLDEYEQSPLIDVPSKLVCIDGFIHTNAMTRE
jgi:very-short-patch-repair endonuclease